MLKRHVILSNQANRQLARLSQKEVRLVIDVARALMTAPTIFADAIHRIEDVVLYEIQKQNFVLLFSVGNVHLPTEMVYIRAISTSKCPLCRREEQMTASAGLGV
jgi:hypothetical protein